ncbi:TIGR00341 family protein [Psychrobacter sp. AH5]|uniref:TIGR00341 family protein n=1 Tax=Psychrobacter sp. AH5 TaxID=2937433 RepID=UPI00333FDB9C
MTSKLDITSPAAAIKDDSNGSASSVAEQNQSSNFLDGDFPECCVLKSNALENDSQNADSTTNSNDEQAQDPHNEDDSHSKEAKIYYPEAKATLTAISEEEVLVTVENSPPETAYPDSAELQVIKENKADNLAALARNADDSAIETDSDTTVISAGNGTNNPKKSENDAEPVPDTDTDTDTDDSASDDIKDKKEAKLESYKQFVAEQFSNQKVDYPEVRVKIEANALPSKMYFIMNILSAIIASYGLVTNSAAVVIGAMLVAMMLGPITGVALAIIDHRMPLLWKSLFTVVAGVSLVVIVGFLIGLLHNEQPLTAEILSRTQPTSMDLMIALAGGTAGAYAMVSPHLSVAVVGVAVATALVPPLAASGILFAHGEMQLGFGALLLAITNIIAIQFTNALVLWLLGFRRLIDDDYKSSTYLTFLRRNAVTLLLLAGLGTYLSINLQTNAKQQVFESSTKEAISSYFIDKGNVLTNTQFDTSDENQIVRAVIRGETTPSSYDVRQIEAIISENMAANFPDYLPIKLQLRYLPVQVIEANPLVTDKLDKTDAAILTN